MDDAQSTGPSSLASDLAADNEVEEGHVEEEGILDRIQDQPDDVILWWFFFFLSPPLPYL